MTDDRWNLKGSDRDVITRFQDIKDSYDEQRDENITNDRALALLMDEVPVERDADTKAILEKLDGLADDVAAKTADRIYTDQH